MRGREGRGRENKGRAHVLRRGEQRESRRDRGLVKCFEGVLWVDSKGVLKESSSNEGVMKLS